MSAGAIKAGDAYVELGTRMGAMWRNGLAAAQQRLSAWGSKLTRIGLVGVGAFAVAARFAAKQEEADVRLAAALDRVGVAGKKALPGLKAFASEIQQATIYGDELVESAMTKIVNISGASGDALKKMTVAAIGLAEAYDMDLATASMLVGRAMKGQTQTLARYGIQLDVTASKEDQFNELLKIGAGQFQLAEARAKTASGRFAQMKNALGDMAEKIGQALLPSLTQLFQWLIRIAGPIQQWLVHNQGAILLAAKLTVGLLAVGVGLKLLAGLLAVLQSKLLVFAAVGAAILTILEALNIVDTGFSTWLGNIRLGTFKIATWFNALVIGIQAMWDRLMTWLLKAWYGFLSAWSKASGWIAKKGLELLGMKGAAQEVERMQAARDQGHGQRLAQIDQQAGVRQEARQKELQALFDRDRAAWERERKKLGKGAQVPVGGALAKALAGGPIGVPGLAAAVKAKIEAVGTFHGGVASLKVATLTPAAKAGQQQVQQQKIMNQAAGNILNEVKKIAKDVHGKQAVAVLG